MCPFPQFWIPGASNEKITLQPGKAMKINGISTFSYLCLKSECYNKNNAILKVGGSAFKIRQYSEKTQK